MTSGRMLHKDVSDGELARVMQPHLEQLMRGVVLGRSFDCAGSGARTASSHEPAQQSDAQPSPEPGELSEAEQEYLGSVLEKPFLTVTGRADQLGLSSYQSNRIKRALVDKGLIAQFAVNLGNRTRGIIKLVELTESGYEALGKIPAKMRPENVSAEHWFWQRCIAQHHSEKGLDVSIEMPLRDVRADVGIIRAGKRIAVEVGITAKNEVANVQRDLDAGFDQVIVAAKNARVLRAIEKRLWAALPSARHHQIKTMLLSEFSFVEQLIKDGRTVGTKGAQAY